MICRSLGPTWLNFSSIITAPVRHALVAASGSSNQVPRRIWIRVFVFASHFAFARPNHGRNVNQL